MTLFTRRAAVKAPAAATARMAGAALVPARRL